MKHHKFCSKKWRFSTLFPFFLSLDSSRIFFLCVCVCVCVILSREKDMMMCMMSLMMFIHISYVMSLSLNELSRKLASDAFTSPTCETGSSGTTFSYEYPGDDPEG